MNGGYDFVRGGVSWPQPEPTDDQRRLATTLYGTYVALLTVGFNDREALAIVTATVAGVATDEGS